MFDIAFSEIVVIAVVALVVIGPERLPKVARTLGHMFGRLQRYVNEVKTDISREMELDELRKLQSEVQSAARDFESSVSSAASSVESGARSIEMQLNDPAAPAASTVASTAALPTNVEASPEAVPSSVVTPQSDVATVPSAAGSHSAELPVTAPVEPPRQAALPGFDRI